MQRAFYLDLDNIEHVAFNSAISEVGVAVENNYEGLKQLWKSQAFARYLKVRKAPTAILYKSLGILLNLHVYLYRRGQIKDFFGVTTTNFTDYLQYKLNRAS